MIKKKELIRQNPKATLNVRSGYRYFLNAIPTIHQADLISAEIIRLFNTWQNDYTKVVADSAHVNRNDLHFQSTQQIRKVLQGTTRIVDYPLLIYNNGIRSFDTRVSLALCTGNTSTKAWARASLPVGTDGKVTPIELGYIHDLHKSYKDITLASVDWISDNVPEIIGKYVDKLEMDRGRFIRISILGINDEIIAQPFFDLSNNSSTISSILEDKDIEEIFTYYFCQIGELKGNLSDYLNKNTKIEPSLLFKIYLWVTLSNGNMERRTVLFLLREKEFTEIIGLAYDDSIEMDISLRAGAKLSKVMGTWI